MISPDEEYDDPPLSPDWEKQEIEGDWYSDDDQLVWEGQDLFLFSEARKVGLFTGAGYGKSQVLVDKGIKWGCEQDGWWDKCDDWRSNPLKCLWGAPQNKYLVTRLIPGFLGRLQVYEKIIGRSLRKPTGRNNDGWFGSQSERRQERLNGVTDYFYSLHNEDSAVAADAGAVLADEATLLKLRNIWFRFQQRRRDPRANSLLTAVVGTPEKNSFMYDEFFDHNDQPWPGVEAFTDASINNPLLTDEFFETLRGASDAYIDAQVMGKWVKGIGGERFANIFDESIHLIPMNIGPHFKNAKFDIGWDPGWASGQVSILYYSKKRDTWYLVDEIVIQGQSTEQACRRLLKMGYNRDNIRRIFMDPKDATKRKSNGPETDEQIVYRVMGIRPRVTSVPGMNAFLRTRLDALAELLRTQRFFINESLRKRNRLARGTVNSINHFALETSEVEEGRHLDKPTRETLREWKHAIDSLHYVFMNYEHKVYRKAHRNTKEARQAHRRRKNARSNR